MNLNNIVKNCRKWEDLSKEEEKFIIDLIKEQNFMKEVYDENEATNY